MDHALDHCFVRDSVVTDRELEAEGLRRGWAASPSRGSAENSAGARLFVREVDGKMLVTSPAVLADEKEMTAFARNGRGTCPMLAGLDRAFCEGLAIG